jgi:hypothetical protein
LRAESAQLGGERFAHAVILFGVAGAEAADRINIVQF